MEQGEVVHKMPAVSVITIFLNAENFIEEAIRSVFAQTYEDWELILVDDGSSDRSTEIALQYARQYPEKVRYIEHEGHVNRGMSASRNVGIREAQGEYIALLDADDIWLPGKLARQAAVLRSNSDVGVVFNPLIHLYGNGSRDVQPTTLTPGRHDPGEWTVKMLESDDNGACPSSVMMRKKIALAVGGFEESFRGVFQLFEDQVMWNKVGLLAPLYYDPEPMTLYRMHDTSCWGRSALEEQQLARIHLYSWLINHIKNLDTDRFRMALQSAIVRYHKVWLRYLVDMEQFDTAASFVVSLESQVPVFPPDGELYYLAAVSLHLSGTRPDTAIDLYSKSLKNGFDEFWVLYNRGSLYLARRRRKKAMRDIERAVSLNPAHEGARQILNKILKKTEK